MRTLTILVGTGLMIFTGLAATQAQQPNPIQGTPGSIFPYAAAHEIRMINGVPCRTILVDGITRVPVECAR